MSLESSLKSAENFFLTLFFCGSFGLGFALGAWASYLAMIGASVLSLFFLIYEWNTDKEEFQAFWFSTAFGNLVMWGVYLFLTYPEIGSTLAHYLVR